MPVLTEVCEHVDELVPHAARRLERQRMIAIGKERALTKYQAIELFREANRKPAHRTLEYKP